MHRSFGRHKTPPYRRQGHVCLVDQADMWKGTCKYSNWVDRVIALIVRRYQLQEAKHYLMAYIITF